MTNVESLKDALIDELKDLYSCETQILKALPAMEKKATNETLKGAFKKHLGETEGQVERLKQISELVDEKLTGKVCKATQGLLEEGKDVLESESPNPAIIDTLLIGAARRVEHYEIAAYTCAIAMANACGESKIAKILGMTLNEESKTDQGLSKIADSKVLALAAEDTNQQDEAVSHKERANER